MFSVYELKIAQKISKILSESYSKSSDMAVMHLTWLRNTITHSSTQISISFSDLADLRTYMYVHDKMSLAQTFAKINK